jgi:large subunit ribosomal protein L31
VLQARECDLKSALANRSGSGKMRAYFSPVTGCGARQGSGGGDDSRSFDMKADIHPKYEAVTATCSCGNTIQTRSTLCEDLHVDVCSQCHPFFTGKQKIVDSGGRVDRFKKRFGSRGSKR